MIPIVFQIFEGKATTLSVCFFPLLRMLRPDTGRVRELSFPWLQVAIEIGDELVLFVRHASAEIGD